MTDLRYIIPESQSGETVEMELGAPLVCPYCRAQSTGCDRNADTGWVQTPLRRSFPAWICVGCCIDLYSTSLSEDFDSHPYRDLLGEAADLEGISVEEARRICLEHQRTLIEQRCAGEEFGRFEDVYNRIGAILDSLE